MLLENSHSWGSGEPVHLHEAIGLLKKTADADATTASLEILLVEDDDADAYLIETALSKIPEVKAVVRARDGVEALTIVDGRKHQIHMAIVDLRMPRKDGFELLAELDARILADFPSVVLSSSRAQLDVYRAGKKGAWKYLTKQSSVARMTRSLKRVIRAVS
ncbi:response regulator [Sphingobium sp. DEHP117]|uniref:response regulator n=1 Tax=Sphingobium sp. DEHP117 TaxID=2993436 RepID=UPI0027D588C3|nr:response regulator [Sphingobium sp. DEHP117]MDQ4419043.1 response regulator [Sphingobium sp. DEHP117]